MLCYIHQTFLSLPLNSQLRYKNVVLFSPDPLSLLEGVWARDHMSVSVEMYQLNIRK